MPAATSVLKAAAFTYVAAALVTLLDISRWLRVLRF
jgi:Zn-dependent membrane protease YugP